MDGTALLPPADHRGYSRRSLQKGTPNPSLVRGEKGLDVGDRLRVRLANVDVDRGFIDFERA